MSMCKKDYDFLARLIAALQFEDGVLACNLSQDIEDYYRKENPRFDVVKWRKACGREIT